MPRAPLVLHQMMLLSIRISLTVAKLKRTLQKLNLSNVEYELIDGQSTLVFSLAEEALELPETHKLEEMLRLTPGKAAYPIRMNDIDHNPNLIRLRTAFRYGSVILPFAIR